MANNIAIIKTELAGVHPVTGVYDVDNQLAADQLNVVNRTTNKTEMSASEVYNAIDVTNWLALTDAQRQEIWDILHLGTINPFGFEATRFTTIFGGGSATITALAAARVNNVSRAVELGIGVVKRDHVRQARL